MPVRPLGHHELLLLLLQMALLLLFARLCGELARRVRIPAVVGELTAGVLLGPSVFGALWPELQQAIFPLSQHQSDLLSVVTWLGVIFLLLFTGLETDIALIQQQGRKAALISLGGIAVPFGLGVLLGRMLPADLLAAPDQRLVFSLFVATAMSISAIPVIARVLMEMNVVRRDIGQLTLAAGMIDDTIGWILLSVVAGLASAGTISLWLPIKSILAVGGVLLFAFTIGRRLITVLYRFVDERVPDGDGLVSLTAVLVLLVGAATQALGLEAVLGAFIFGIVLRDAPRYRPEVTHSLEQVTTLVLAPIFFAAAGLKVNLLAFADRTLLFWAAVVVAVACLGKFVGGYLGSRVAGLTRWEGFSMGSGMNARGAMEIIVATIGLSLGVLSIDMYSIIVLVAIVTSLIAPPMLRFGLLRVEVRPEEAARLEREEQERRSFWAGLRRVLLPARGGASLRLAARLLGQALEGRNVEVTLLDVRYQRRRFWPWSRAGEDEGGVAWQELLERLLAPLVTLPRSVTTRLSAASVITATAREHDLTVMAAPRATTRWDSIFTFGPLIDETLKSTDHPVLVVRATQEAPSGSTETPSDLPIRRILVPATGTSTGQAALELGLTLAERLSAGCTILYVEESAALGPGQYVELPVDRELFPEADRLIEQPIERRILRAQRPGHAIVRVAAEGGYDLIVLSAQVRPGTRRAYLGPQVDFTLRAAPCPVAVLVTP